ncbi:sulfotransferase domain-containing protein [Lyngbya aestuarii]|uniref:sulfotransferase domain-containing protein n=1 Tax=Lyngbya aestuarii TaxID=118322 RepID=UPI00403E284B
MSLEHKIKSLTESDFLEIVKRVSTLPMPNNQQEAYRLVRYLDLKVTEIAKIRGKDVSEEGIKVNGQAVGWSAGSAETDSLKERLLDLAKQVELNERVFQSQKPTFEVVWQLNSEFDAGVKRWQQYQDLAVQDIEARLPNFVVLGAPKSATTWLYACLAAHPDVFVPTDKELDFFGTHRYEMGINWYKQKFINWSGQKACGEVSVGYFSYEEAPQQILNSLGKDSLKLIVLLREPIDCDLSFYFHWLLRGEAPKTFEESLKFRRFRRFYHRTVHYDQHYQKYLRFFSEEQILVLLFEEIQQQPLFVLQRVFEFLNIEPDFYDQVFDKKQNVGRSINNLSLHYLLHHTGIICRELLPHQKVGNKISSTLRQLNNQINIAPQRPALQIAPWLYRQLQEEYRQSNQRLAELAKLDLSVWETSDD